VSTRELIVLGTAGQSPTRERSPGGCALKWDGELVLFDPGEGCQRQCLFAGVAVSRASALLLTHLHGDHCLGLPGVLQRRILDNAPSRLQLFFPAQSADVLDHLLRSSLFTETDLVDFRPVDAGAVGHIGQLEVTAAVLDHPVPTLGYRLSEPASTRLDGAHLRAAGIQGPDVGTLVREGSFEVAGRRRNLEEFQLPRPGQSMAYVLDTALCDAAIELATGVDLLVCEATYLNDEQHWARERGHMTAREAGWLAREAGARRLVITHFSSRYSDLAPFAAEAGELHDDVVVATDLATVAVPARVVS
jgi:ribonuclease Z